MSQFSIQIIIIIGMVSEFEESPKISHVKASFLSKMHKFINY